MHVKELFKMSDRSYELLKWTVQIVLPALGTLYTTLALLWGWPYSEQIVGSIVALTLFLGLVLKISNSTYVPPEPTPDGVLVFDDTNPDKDLYTFEMDTPIFDLMDGDSLNIKVKKPSGS